MSLQDVADELYALPPEDFTAARDAAAKAAGKGLKTEVKALRRPTVSAWLVNRLARDRADLLEQLLALGPALAEAQAGGSGDALRRLGAQRRELVQAVVETAVQDAGRDVTAATRAEVEQTLEAALADPATADAVRSGHLVRAVTYAGFGGVDLEGAVAVSAPPRPAPRRRKDTADPVEEAERAALDASAALDDAVRACERAQRERESAEQDAAAAAEQRDEAATRVAELEAQLADARRTRDAATRAADRAAATLEKTVRQADAAMQDVRDAQDRAEQARAGLDRLRRG